MKRQVVFFFAVFSSCATVNEVVNPMENPLTSWIFDKSCISVDVPAITLTSEKTAIEKQILGEKTELLPEGWLITASGFVHPLKERGLLAYEEIRSSVETLELYRSVAEYYMIKSYLGIDTQGNFLIVPEKLRQTTEPKHMEIAMESMKIMNQNKEKVLAFLMKKDPLLAGEFLESYKRNFRHLGWNYDRKTGWFKK